jgi:glutathione S-transferase
MATITVNGPPISTCVRIVRLLLEETGAGYELKSVGFLKGEANSAECRAKNPFGKVQTVQANGEIIYETAAITEYLDTIVASHRFSPSDPLTRARMRHIMEITAGYLYSSAIRTIVIQRIIVPSRGG